MNTIEARFEAVQAKIRDACTHARRSANDVKLIVVSKTQPIESIECVVRAGHRVFGENYVQELCEKRALSSKPLKWHLIGHLQTNKAKRVVDVEMIHTVDSLKVAEAVARAAISSDRTVNILIEVNIGNEPKKSGVPSIELPALAEALRSLKPIRLQGLMCIPPEGEGRRYFAQLRDLRDRVEASLGSKLPELSMGMSADYEDAILEGATLVRVGTAIFGQRTSR